MIARHELPRLALSVRQPWAWAIIHARKPFENRSNGAVRHMLPLRGPRAIHAAKTMTREDYNEGRDFMRSLGIECPPPAELLRGGIIGRVDVIDCVRSGPKTETPWFHGPRALVLANAAPCEFIPSVGDRGYFAWEPADPSIVPEPAKWMLPSTAVEAAAKARAKSPQLDLIDLAQTSTS